MKALLKTGETIEIIPNDDFCAAKYINKETTEYVFNDEIVEIINEESGKPMNMTPEEMAKAYAEGFSSKEYREVAYDAFLCGYTAKCLKDHYMNDII